MQLLHALLGVLGQRLVRKLCSCHTDEAPTNDYIKRLNSAGWTQVPDRIARPVGCPKCDKTGYKGRVGIYEMLVVDQSIRAALRGGFKPEVIRQAAQAAGMCRMQDDAFEKLHMGVTTLEEILRVVPIENIATEECTGCGHELIPVFHFCPFCGIRRDAGAADNKSKSTQLVSDGVLSR